MLTTKTCYTALLLFAATFGGAQSQFYSRHFKLEKLADGVYAAIASTGGFAICNAGIVDLGEATLIVDPFMTPEAAEDLKKAAADLTGHPVRYVVNTHFHNDHTGGNQVFGDAVIISTERARSAMQRELPGELEGNRAHAAETVEQFRRKETGRMNAHELLEHQMMKSYFEALAASTPDLRLTYPGLCFSDSLWLHGSRRSVLLRSCGDAHSDGDLMVQLPQEKILFTGDVLFIGCHPWLGDGDMAEWDALLSQLQKEDHDILVPGHGRKGSREDLQPLRDYMKEVRVIAERYRREGRPPQSDNLLKVPEAFAEWTLSGFFKPNVYGAWGRLAK